MCILDFSAATTAAVDVCHPPHFNKVFDGFCEAERKENTLNNDSEPGEMRELLPCAINFRLYFQINEPKIIWFLLRHFGLNVIT